MSREHSHYHKSMKHLDSIDVYRVLSLFNVTDPCIQHAVKKLLVTGGRGGAKDFDKDIQDAIDTLKRLQDIRKEDTLPKIPKDVLVSCSWGLENGYRVRESEFHLYTSPSSFYRVIEVVTALGIEYRVNEHEAAYGNRVLSCGRFTFDSNGTPALSLGVWDERLIARLSALAVKAAASKVVGAY